MKFDACLGYSVFVHGRYHFFCQLLAEFVGTLFIVLIGCGSTVSGWQQGDVATIFRIALAFGLAVCAVVEVFGRISGGHVNPAITVAMMIVRRIQLVPGLLYIAFQIMGATSGAALLKALTPMELNSTLGLNTIDERLTIGQGLGVEFMVTFFLLLVVFSVTDIHREENKGTVSIAIGMAVTVGHLFSIRYTGCGMNPARVFASSAVIGEWTNQWVYWVGECLGAILAAIVYLAFFTADTRKFIVRLRSSFHPGYESLEGSNVPTSSNTSADTEAENPPQQC